MNKNSEKELFKTLVDYYDLYGTAIIEIDLFNIVINDNGDYDEELTNILNRCKKIGCRIYYGVDIEEGLSVSYAKKWCASKGIHYDYIKSLNYLISSRKFYHSVVLDDPNDVMLYKVVLSQLADFLESRESQINNYIDIVGQIPSKKTKVILTYLKDANIPVFNDFSEVNKYFELNVRNATNKYFSCTINIDDWNLENTKYQQISYIKYYYMNGYFYRINFKLIVNFDDVTSEYFYVSNIRSFNIKRVK